MPPRKPQQPNDPDSKTSIDEFLQLIPDAVRMLTEPTTVFLTRTIWVTSPSLSRCY